MDGTWFDITEVSDEHFYGLGGAYILEGDYKTIPLSLKMNFNKSKHIMTSADIFLDTAQEYTPLTNHNSLRSYMQNLKGLEL